MEEFVHLLLEKKIFPGISILIGKEGKVSLKKQYGWKSIEPVKESLKEYTLYDLASLTKPLITALLTVYLLQTDKSGLKLNTPIRKVLPKLPVSYEITLEQLLTHTSGLPSWYPFFLFGEDYFNRFNSIQLQNKPGKKVVYSCVGYILLYYFIQMVSGMPYKEMAGQVIFEPLGLKHSFLSVPGSLKDAAAPTERGNQYERKLLEQWIQKNSKGNWEDIQKRMNTFNWRTNIIQGDTNDLNSHFLGGTAGNAGLFSTVDDILILSKEFFPSTGSILKPESIELFWKNFTPFKISNRTIGFKRNSSIITSGGKAFSRTAIGHNGFTGTSIWLDKHCSTTAILLTNRIHPTYKAINFDKIRRKLHRLLLQVTMGG